MKFIQVKRVKFILDFLDLFTKENERIFLLEKLIERYEKRCGEVMRELEERIKSNREEIEETGVLTKDLKKRTKVLQKKIEIQEKRVQEMEDERL